MKVDTQALKAKIVYQHKTQKEIAKDIGLNRVTFSNRLQHGKFTIFDIHKMMISIPLDMAEVMEIFYSRE